MNVEHRKKYKTNSSWRILIQYWVCPREFSRMKKFMTLSYPVRDLPQEENYSINYDIPRFN